MRDVHHGDTSSVSSDGREKPSTPPNGKRLDPGWGPLRGNPPPQNSVTIPNNPAAGNSV